MTGAHVVLYHIFMGFSRGFRKIGFFVTDFFAVPSTSRFGADFFFFASKCFPWSSPNEIKGAWLPLREQRELERKTASRRRGWHWTGTVLSSERAVAGQRKRGDGCKRRIFKRLGFREDLLSPFRVLSDNARAAAFSVRQCGDFTQTLHKRDVTFDFAVIGYNGLGRKTDKISQSKKERNFKIWIFLTRLLSSAVCVCSSLV